MRKNLYKGWTHVSGKLKQVSVSGHNDEVVWGVNNQDRIYRRRGDVWEQVEGRLKHVSCGESGVWGVNSANDIFYRKGTYGGSKRKGDGWERVSGKLSYISSGSRGEVWGVNKHGNIYYREGVTSDNPTGSRWKQVGGRLKTASVWRGQVWGVNSNDNIYQA